MTAYSLHPGIIFTPLYQHSYSLESLKGRVVQTMLYPFSKSVPQVCPEFPGSCSYYACCAGTSWRLTCAKHQGIILAEGLNSSCLSHPESTNQLIHIHPAWWALQRYRIHGLDAYVHVQGAATSIHCATAPGIEPHSGAYFSNCKVTAPKATAEDMTVAEKLWRLSEQLTGISYT